MTSLQAISALDRLLQGDATAFHEHAVLGFATPEDDLRASGSLARGRDEIAAAPVLRGGGHALVRVGGGREVFAEGRVGQASFVASLRLDGEGRVERGLWLSSAAVEPSPTWTGAPGADADARPILDRYFAHLEAAEFEEAAACFAEDCVYLHPPYERGGERVAFHGRDELLHGWRTVRGQTASRRVVTATAQRGADCIIEGVVEGIPNGGSFLSSVSLAPDGLIRRYAAWYAAIRVETG
jgi:hypothetical protein